MTGERIVIAGAGPVGVIAAILLARRGMPSLIIERHAEPYGLPRAVHIDDDSLIPVIRDPRRAAEDAEAVF